MSSNCRPRPSRIHRRSLVLHSRIDGAPMRQPFLKHIADDDFLTAYLGYDDVQSLDRLRLSSLAIVNFIFMRIKDIDWGKRYFVMKTISQVLSIRHFKVKLKEFWRLMLDDKTRFGPDARLFVECICRIAKSTNLVEDVGPRYRSRAMISGFMNFISSQRGYAITRLPDPGPVIEAPVFMEDEQDLEGLLKAAALLFSLEELTKPSIWASRYPGPLTTDARAKLPRRPRAYKHCIRSAVRMRL